MTTENTYNDIDGTVDGAAKLARSWAASDSNVRANVLRVIAHALEHDSEELISQADAETHLGRPRLAGELSRTVFQLRGFAENVQKGAAFTHLAEEAVALDPPAGRPHLMRVRVPVGPVAVFAASNFPFAFSVLGGDTASALAAGCPVVVKAHPAHPELSRRMHAAATNAISSQGIDPALLGLIEGDSPDVGQRLVRHPGIAAVAFTGSLQGGLALQAQVAQRQVPIPFYGELGSVNPVIVMPEAPGRESGVLARTLAASMTLGCAQFCTSPGLIIVVRSRATEDGFVAALAEALATQSMHMMLSPAIRAAYDAGVKRLLSCPDTEIVLGGITAPSEPPRPVMVRASIAAFLKHHALRQEVFGPASVLVEVDSASDVAAVLHSLGGTLTTTIWGASEPTSENITVVQGAVEVSGRVIFSGVPTGVAVTQSQHHGGPFPCSTQPFTTSVGYFAMDRFLRPLALQDAPAWITARHGRPL